MGKPESEQAKYEYILTPDELRVKKRKEYAELIDTIIQLIWEQIELRHNPEDPEDRLNFSMHKAAIEKRSNTSPKKEDMKDKLNKVVVNSKMIQHQVQRTFKSKKWEINLTVENKRYDDFYIDVSVRILETKTDN